MGERTAWIVGIVALVAVAAGLYLTRNRLRETAPQPAPPVERAPAQAEPAIRHPIPQAEQAPAAEAAPLPPLAESDVPVKEAVSGLIGQDAAQLLMPDGIVRRFVATVDNLPRKKIALQIRPVAGAPGAFVVNGQEDDELTLSEDNYARYAPFVKLVEASDPKQLAAVYLRFYPLMQESYEGLGYPNRYFNDRMVEVIDHLLATPDVKGPIRLTQPHVFYEFADPRLEGLSAGQKTLIRMGSANAATVKQKLTALRREIVKSQHAGSP